RQRDRAACLTIRSSGPLRCGCANMLLIAAAAAYRSVSVQMQAAGSFTVKFHEHLPLTQWHHAIQAFQSCGSQVEQQSSHQFLLVCEQESQVSEVGVCLFHTHFKSLANVVAVSGIARAEANAYHFPTSRSERKKYR